MTYQKLQSIACDLLGEVSLNAKQYLIRRNTYQIDEEMGCDDEPHLERGRKLSEEWQGFSDEQKASVCIAEAVESLKGAMAFLPNK